MTDDPDDATVYRAWMAALAMFDGAQHDEGARRLLALRVRVLDLMRRAEIENPDEPFLGLWALVERAERARQ